MLLLNVTDNVMQCSVTESFFILGSFPQQKTAIIYHESNPEFKTFLKIPLMVRSATGYLFLSLLIFTLFFVNGAFRC